MKNTNTHKKHRKVVKRKTMRGGAARYPTSAAASHRPSHGPSAPSHGPSASSHGPSAVASHGPIDKRIGVSDIPLQTNINHITLSYKKGAHFFSCVGIPIEKLQDRYDATTKSDHAPILYSINAHLAIITWNIAQYGNFYNQATSTTPESYNHKFPIQRTETLIEYTRRLTNIVLLMKQMLNNTILNAFPMPFLFCQELPKKEHCILKTLLKENNLQLLGTGGNECGVIYNSDEGKSPLEYINKIPDEIYFKNKQLQKDNPINMPDNIHKNRYSIYKNIAYNDYIYYYVIMHVAYDDDFIQDIVNYSNFLKIANVEEKDNVKSIYFVGDFNRSLLHQDFEGLEHFIIKLALDTSKRQQTPPLYKAYEIFTTKDNTAFSFADNSGRTNPANVDGILKVNFI